ncbi:uncharacterized protein TRIADDRAFT_38009 [Trichoplax adhaerens]|uniref:GOLD domain-containing protein n=1 Tax=Trichoplax adhaerens TaxID=10228 RepID=B3S308_TRIAD|nr:hypothetical protein TRIADDRAFT_38009 [Trichoplax adhaerens]EDV22884.1 hypothetical protein TRIADDRAFT_38009 [Trichoplax adhaerens]|eukprot:XP_002114750.1 hypothetical protein TRIADDRAFT_38009 [Trichoplax adhaerens]
MITWLSLVCSVDCLYFHMKESSKKCFIEEIPEETMVMVNYRVQKFDEQQQKYLEDSPGIGIHVDVKDPSKKMLLNKFYEAKGRITFTSHTSGEHVICLYSNSSRGWFNSGKLRVHLAMSIGEHANDYGNMAEKQKLSDLQIRLRQLIDQTDQIAKEQGYQRSREERFRTTSDSTNTRVLWWSVAQTLVLIATGIWQMTNLKRFFEAKKLV